MIVTSELFNEVRSHFKEVRATVDELICECPCCHHKKLYISTSDDGERLLLTCFHGCSYKDILSAAGLEPRQLYLTKTRGRLSRDKCATKREHIYNDREGRPLNKKTIYKYHSYWEYNGKQEFPGDKETFWSHYEGGEWKNGKASKVLYHLDKLAGDTVYIVEGEKDVETLERLGYMATSAGGGAKETCSEWMKNNYLSQLEGITTAFVLADNDTIGKDYAGAVANYLTRGGISCKVVNATDIYSESLNKWDISDIVGAVGDDRARELLDQATQAAAVFTPTEEQATTSPSNDNPFNADGLGRLSRENLAAALSIMDITVRHNLLNHQVEYSGSGLDGIDPAGVAATIPHLIYDTLQHKLRACNSEKISNFLNIIAFSKANEYNPVIETIRGTKWDGRDHLEELYALMNLDPADTLSRALLKRWLMQAYCGLHNSLDEPFPLDILLVLVGAQGWGKTRLFEKLALSRKYFGEGLTLDPRDKDTRMQATSYWLAELGEIGSTMRKDMNALKAFISNPTDENRPPYGKTSIKHPRLTSFCGTTNDMRFLIDDTGNRRFATIKLPDDKPLDLKELHKFNALQLWAQIADIVETAIQEGETYSSAFRLTREEAAALEQRNKLHSKLLKGEQEVSDILEELRAEELQGTPIKYVYVTPTQFRADHLDTLRPYTAANIGKVLQKLGHSMERKKIDGTVQRVYSLPYRDHHGELYQAKL